MFKHDKLHEALQHLDQQVQVLTEENKQLREQLHKMHMKAVPYPVIVLGILFVALFAMCTV